MKGGVIIKILLGCESIKARKTLEGALEDLGFYQPEIISFHTSSEIHEKLIDHKIIESVEKRNLALKTIAFENNIQYDYLCSIESGISVEGKSEPFIVTYCITENRFGEKFIGKSFWGPFSKRMLEYMENGGSIEQLIQEVLKQENNERLLSIMRYLKNNFYDSIEVDRKAIISSFISEQEEKLDEPVKQFMKNFK